MEKKAADDLLDFKSKRKHVTFLMNEARRDFYSEFMAENGSDQRKLFNPFPSNHADVSGKLPLVFLWSFVGSKKEPRLLSVLECLGDSKRLF